MQIGSAVVTAVGDSASAQTILAAGSGRLGFSLTNDSSAVAYVKFGSGASLTSYTFQLGQGDTYETPAELSYVGLVTAIWASDAGGSMRVTELI